MVAAGNNKPENTIMIDNSKKKEIATTIGTKAVAWLTSKGWGATLAKVTVGAVLGAAIGIAAALGMTGCRLRTDGAAAFQGLNPAVQIQAAEAVYTAMGGDVKYRLVPVEESKK